MVQNIQKFTDAVVKSSAISKEYLLDNALKEVTEEKESLLSELQEESGIKVPIVGDFSAGKSSLINCLLQRNDLLPVDISPETAVAYEIYYSETERVELYREGQKIEEKSTEAIKELTVRPGDIAKVYVNVPIIKEYQEKGIILVDMPGIDSGIKKHQDAIMNYINKGTSFVLLTDSETGSLRESTIHFITEISKYNLKPAVLISKIDKKPENEIADIKEYVSFQAKRAVKDQPFVGCISSANNDIADFTRFIDSLDSNELISAKFTSRVSNFVNLQIINITSRKDLLNADIQDIDEKIKKLEEEKSRVAAQLADPVPNADTPEKSTQDILDRVKSELHLHAEEIATKIVNKEDANTINAMIMNLIRPVVINAFKEEGEQYANAMNSVVDDVSRALQDSLTIDGNLIDDIVEDMRSQIVGALQIAAEWLKLGGAMGQVIGWILTFVSEKIPDLIRWFFGKSTDSIIAEATEKIRSVIIDKIAENLRPILLEQVKAQQQRIRENIQKKVTNGIDNLKECMKANSEKGAKEDLTNKIAAMESAITQLTSIKASL